MSDNEARPALRALEQRMVENRMRIYGAEFLNGRGRRKQVEEAQSQ